ncbi:MAG: flagellar basal body-associated FliL family protein [Gallionella sp.]|nr:flagellar basal body-associated FliL family protein [Gallionella sp.]
MAKPGKSAEADEVANEPPKKGRTKLIIIIAVVAVLVIGAGVAAFFLMGQSHELTPAEKAEAEKVEEKADEEASAKNPPKYVDLGTFTANLVREESDQYLQVAISLKLTRPELEERVKNSSPEIMHRVNMLLQSKRPSELITYEDKKRLAGQIKEQVEYVLHMRKIEPVISSDPLEAPPTETKGGKSGITEVLFTSFIIQ